MMIEKAVVVAYENGVATVKCYSQRCCSNCSAKKNCGMVSLADLAGQKDQHIFNIKSSLPLKIGQSVEIGLEERSVLSSTLLIYVIPLLTLLLSAMLGSWLFHYELANFLFIVIMTGTSFLAIHKLTSKLSKKSNYQLVLLRTS